MWKFILSLLLAATCSAQVFSPELIGALVPQSSSAGNSPPVPGYTLWLTADNPSSMFTNVAGTIQATGSVADASKFVAKWKDLSLSGTNSVFMDIPTGSFERRPALSNVIVELNNKPGLIFGARDFTTEERTWLQTATNNVLLGATGMTMFAVSVKIAFAGSAGDSFPMLMGFDFAGAKSWEMRVEGASGATTTNMDAVIDGGTVSTTAQGFRIGRGYCWTLRGDNRDTANWAQWKNGVQSTAVNLATDMFPKSDGLAVGSRWTSIARDNCWHGIISEVVIYPFSLSDLQVSNVTYYLTNKYALHDP